MRESMTSLLHLQEMREFFRTPSGRGLAAAIIESEFFEAISVMQRNLDDGVMSTGDSVLKSLYENFAFPPTLLELMDPKDGPRSPAEARARWESGFRYNTDLKTSGGALTRWLVDVLEKAEPWWTHPDMTRLTNTAAQDINEDHPVYASDLPMPWGFVTLGTPVWIGTEDVIKQRIDAILWAQNGDGVTLIGCSARHGADDRVGTEIARHIDRKWLPPTIPAQIVRLHFGRPVPNEAVARFMAAWWRLVDQPLAARSRATATSVEAKRDKRLRKIGGITEVRLRAQKIHRLDNEPRSVDWQQRWIVRGHWRDQPYKDGHIEKIYIAPYVKGPEDKPLVITQKIYRWDR